MPRSVLNATVRQRFGKRRFSSSSHDSILTDNVEVVKHLHWGTANKRLCALWLIKFCHQRVQCAVTGICYAVWEWFQQAVYQAGSNSTIFSHSTFAGDTQFSGETDHDIEIEEWANFTCIKKVLNLNANFDVLLIRAATLTGTNTKVCFQCLDCLERIQ